VPSRRLRAPRIDFGALRRELKLPGRFPLAAQREAERAAARAALPGSDRTDIPFVTIDPATSLDLDQAVCLRPRRSGGYRVHYAIADVASFVAAGGALEAETWRRGQTIYLPDGKVPLHPKTLSEGAASLLPDADRAAVLWTIELDRDGETVAVHVERARVRSRAKLDYTGVQAAVDTDQLPEPIALLPAVGRLLVARGLARGAINLPVPEQEVAPDGTGWRLVLRAPVPVEEWNAQISLLTGMAAARLMLDAGVGLLRTMPAARPDALTRLRTAAAALGIGWPDHASLGQVIASVDPAQPRVAAFLDHAAELMRGAGYSAFDGIPPPEPAHGAVAAPYAHVTAPLRRLADRYATEAALAIQAGREVPEWTRSALPKLPAVMAETDRVAGAAERGAVDLTEATLLAGRVGEDFEAAVIDVDGPPPAPAAGQPPRAPTPGQPPASGKVRAPGGVVALDEPPVRARCDGDLPLGERVRVRLVEADPKRRTVRFALP
jgi:exoribonuclease R